MSWPESVPDPLTTRLLDTRACAAINSDINDFENRVFGGDFFCPVEKAELWLRSGALFYSAICGEAVAGCAMPLAVTSLFITNRESMERVFSGELADYDLNPWFLSRGSTEPVVYLASIVSHNSNHRVMMLESLLNDVEPYLRQHRLQISSGFAIASGPAGYKHLYRSGFVPRPGKMYLDKYHLMTIDADRARTSFWRCLLRSRPAGGPVVELDPPSNASGNSLQRAA